ncbi:MAG: Rieske 2Fe-2S domain-containing protein, partial [Nitrososphaerales archaeon]
MTWTRIGSRDSIAVGKGKEFVVGGKQVAVFNMNGTFYALEALCRHQDGPLAEGMLQGEIV